MDEIINYFSNAPDSHRILLLAGSFFVFGAVEQIIPLSKGYKKIPHSINNALFMLTAAPIQILGGYALVQAIGWTIPHHWGLLYHIPGMQYPLLLFLVTFILLDFFEYIYHVVMHKVKRLWMFHLVHHSDRIVDVSTTLREHPGETFIRLSFLVLWVFLLGACFWALLFRQFIQIFSNVFAHSHFRLNEKLDRVVGLIFITPNLHHVHHHFEQPYTDKNYGDILSIWDRIFGTFARMGKSEIVFGVDNYMEEKENTNFANLSKIPFGKYRSNKK